MHTEGQILKFGETTWRLYYFDAAEWHEDLMMLATTVDDNKSKFLACDYSKAEIARSIQ
jgi:hypothetical protein